MTMNSGGFNAKRAPLVQAIQQMDASKELIRSNKIGDYITMLEPIDAQEATDFASCLYKCRRHHLDELEEFYWMVGKSRVAVKGRRSMMYSQTLARLLVPEFYGGKGDNTKEGKDLAKDNI